jgi:hypothetical protein
LYLFKFILTFKAPTPISVKNSTTYITYLPLLPLPNPSLSTLTTIENVKNNLVAPYKDMYEIVFKKDTYNFAIRPWAVAIYKNGNTSLYGKYF